MEGNPLPFLLPRIVDRVGRVYSYDVDTSLVVLCDPASSGRRGVWVDVTLCLNPKYSAPWKREPMHMVTVIGYLEPCEVRLFLSDCSVVTGSTPAPTARTFSRWRSSRTSRGGRSVDIASYRP